MSESLEAAVWSALRSVKFPGLSRDVVSFGFVKRVEIEDAGRVSVELEVPTQNPGSGEKIREQVEQTVRALDGVAEVRVSLKVTTPRSPAQAQQRAVMADRDLIPGVKHVIAVASGKGGVGKSTVSSHLATALAALGKQVGLFDCDIYGPSIPTMFGISGPPQVVGKRVQPFHKYGVSLMSLGFILDDDSPVIWRGPMVMKAIEQMLGDVDWGELDYMIVDLPPGTGDAQLTLTQRVPLSGAVIVSTPQDVALIDARKGLAMFHKVAVPVLGIVENMSYFVCGHCGERTDVFKHGGGERVAKELGVPFLGAVPLDAAIVEGGDAGVPVTVAEPEGAHAAVFRELARSVMEEVERHAAEQPTLSIL